MRNVSDKNIFDWFNGEGLDKIAALGEKQMFDELRYTTDWISYYPSERAKMLMLVRWNRMYGEKSEEKYTEITGQSLYGAPELDAQHFERGVWSKIQLAFTFSPPKMDYSFGNPDSLIDGNGGRGNIKILSATASGINLLPILPRFLVANDSFHVKVDAFKYENGAHFYTTDIQDSQWSIHVKEKDETQRES